MTNHAASLSLSLFLSAHGSLRVRHCPRLFANTFAKRPGEE